MTEEYMTKMLQIDVVRLSNNMLAKVLLNRKTVKESTFVWTRIFKSENEMVRYGYGGMAINFGMGSHEDELCFKSKNTINFIPEHELTDILYFQASKELIHRYFPNAALLFMKLNPFYFNYKKYKDRLIKFGFCENVDINYPQDSKRNILIYHL